MTTIHTGSNNGCAECGRDYEAIESMVSLVQDAVNEGFDHRDDVAYEFFASEGQYGDPDNLSDHTFAELAADLEDLAADAQEYLIERGHYARPRA